MRARNARCPLPAIAFDFRAHFSHSAPMETHALGFRLPANAPEGQKRFPTSFHNYVDEEIPVIRKLLFATAAALLFVSRFAHAEVPWTFSNDTRYLV